MTLLKQYFTNNIDGALTENNHILEITINPTEVEETSF